MKKTKYFVLIILISVLALSIYYVIKDYRVRTDTKREQLAYVALLSDQTMLNQAALSCQQTALQRREDYPGILQGKSVEDIKQLILSQPANC